MAYWNGSNLQCPKCFELDAWAGEGKDPPPGCRSHPKQGCWLGLAELHSGLLGEFFMVMNSAARVVAIRAGSLA